jgi:hypothetical protein
MAAAERVAKGAALLDERMPGWTATDRRGAWALAAHELEYDWRRLAEHGFEIVYDTANPPTNEAAAVANTELDELWTAEIRRRAVERDHLVRHGVPAAQGHTHTCDEHGHTVRHTAGECRPSNYRPEGCLL